VVFAVNTGAVATPLEFVVAVFTPPAKVPLAPVPGAENVTVIPLVGAPFVVTVAASCVANAVPTAALCGVPPLALTDMTGGGLIKVLPEALQPTSAAIVAKATSNMINRGDFIARLRSRQLQRWSWCAHFVPRADEPRIRACCGS
jgi:hypothetical protein